MKKLFTQKGQIELTVASGLALISFIVGPIIAYYSGQAATKDAIAEVSERTTALETFVPTIDKRLENIERALKLVPGESLTNKRLQ